MYLALYRKWRPKTFDDVVGQTPITTTLRNEVKNNKTAHSYLFTGSRGTGKTTCSKILAMAVNCLNPQDGNPCMECEICRGIEDGSILDVLEIDAASNNGVDDVRILREEANYTPAQCKYRVYIIDETHMLSVSAFNALLKIMEEPPEHVKFILATTEVHKVPATVLSRCQRFDFNRIQTADIADRLLYIAQHESFTLTEDAAYLIARLADGGMRDALSVLDQCVAYSDQVDVAVVSQATGLVLRDYLFRLTDILYGQDAAQALACVDQLYSQSKDLQRLTGELIEHLRNLMIAKTVEKPDELVNCLPEELEQLKSQAQKVSLSWILRGISLLQDCLDKIGREYDKRLSVEMTLIKMCKPELDLSYDALAQRLESLENMIRNGKLIPARQIISPEPEEKKEVPVQAPTAENTPQIPQNHTEEPARRRQPTMAPVLFDLWVEILASLRSSDPALAGMLAGSLAYTAGEILYIDSPNSLLSNMIKRDNFIKILIGLLEEKTGIRYTIRIKKNKPAESSQELSPLDEIAQKAAQMGIEIHQ